MTDYRKLGRLGGLAKRKLYKRRAKLLAKGQYVFFGDGRPRKLDWKQRKRIKRLLKEHSRREVAAMFGVSIRTISRIKKGQHRNQDHSRLLMTQVDGATKETLDSYLNAPLSNRGRFGGRPIKLNKRQVSSIKRMLGAKSQRQIAMEFGVSVRTVGRIAATAKREERAERYADTPDWYFHAPVQSGK